MRHTATTITCSPTFRRRWAGFLVTVAMLVAPLIGVSVAVSGPATAADSPQIAISATTSPLSIYTGNPDEGTPVGAYPQTSMSATITNCPAGNNYSRDYTFVQDGYSASWYYGGLGSYDWYCTGGPQDIGMSFYNFGDPPLHPGQATVTVSVFGNDGGTVATATQTVTIPESAPSAPTNPTGGMTSTTSASLTWSPPVIAGGTITGYRVSRDGGATGAAGWSTSVAAGTRSQTFTNLVAGRTYTLSVAAINAHGTSPSVTATAIPGTPGLPTKVAAKATTSSSVAMTWSTPVTAGSSAITGYRVSRDDAGSGQGPWSTVVSASTRSFTFTKLAATTGLPYTFSVAAINAKGTGSPQTVTRYPIGGTPSYAPTIGTAVAGTAGGAITATATWSYPTWTGGGGVTGYKVRALEMSTTGSILSTTTSTIQSASATSLSMTLPRTGKYRFTVQAINDLGAGPQSAQSNLVAGQ